MTLKLLGYQQIWCIGYLSISPSLQVLTVSFQGYHILIDAFTSLSITISVQVQSIFHCRSYTSVHQESNHCVRGCFFNWRQWALRLRHVGTYRDMQAELQIMIYDDRQWFGERKKCNLIWSNRNLWYALIFLSRIWKICYCGCLSKTQSLLWVYVSTSISIFLSVFLYVRVWLNGSSLHCI